MVNLGKEITIIVKTKNKGRKGDENSWVRTENGRKRGIISSLTIA